MSIHLSVWLSHCIETTPAKITKHLLIHSPRKLLSAKLRPQTQKCLLQTKKFNEMGFRENCEVTYVLSTGSEINVLVYFEMAIPHSTTVRHGSAYTGVMAMNAIKSIFWSPVAVKPLDQFTKKIGTIVLRQRPTPPGISRSIQSKRAWLYMREVVATRRLFPLP